MGKPRWKWSVANESLGKTTSQVQFHSTIFLVEMYGCLEPEFASVPKGCLLKEDEEGHPWRASQDNGRPYNFSGNSLKMSKPE